MTTILEFWENIYGGATTIAKAPDPIMNIPKIKFEAPTWYGAKSTSSGNNPANSTRSDQQIFDLIESYHGDDISLLHQHAEDFGVSLQDAKTQRDETAETVHRLHTEQEGRISENAKAIATHGHDYAGIDHTHTNGNGNGIPWYVMIVGVLAGALIIYMLLKKGIFG